MPQEIANMKILVVIDTNVLVSGLISKNPLSPPVKILKYLSQGVIIPVFSREIINEYINVLHRDKFRLNDEIVNSLVNDIEQNGIEILELQKVLDSMPDPKDIVFYAVVISSKTQTLLVTGNTKHFPQKSFIYTPAQLIELIETGKYEL